MANKNQRITAIDLFSGAGGFSLGFENVGIDVLAAIEFDEKIANTYIYNHKNTIMINSDIRNVKVNKQDSSNGEIRLDSLVKLHDIDIVFGGPPCQGFSMSGNRIRKEKLFLEDERNKLFLEFYRFVKYIQPKIFVIENVPGILNYNDGSVKEEIYTLFSNLGYDVSSKVLSAEYFGVPQKRKRAFFIGNNININSSELFPEKTHEEINFVTVWDAISDLPRLKSGQGEEKSKYICLPKNEYQHLMRKSQLDEVYNHQTSHHSPKTLEILKLIRPGQTLKNLPSKYHTKSIHSGAYGRMEKNKPSYTITTRLNTPSVGKITHPVDDRTITPREAARLQSFPDNYRFIGNATSVGIQIGNSVPPLLSQQIARKIKESLLRE